MKNSNDNIGNRTRVLPACSSVPQPTAPPRAPIPVLITRLKFLECEELRKDKIRSFIYFICNSFHDVCSNLESVTLSALLQSTADDVRRSDHDLISR